MQRKRTRLLKHAGFSTCGRSRVLDCHAAGANAQQPGQKPFCLQKDTGGLMDCSYDTMEQCRKAMTGSTGTCSPRNVTSDGQKQPKKT